MKALHSAERRAFEGSAAIPLLTWGMATAFAGPAGRGYRYVRQGYRFTVLAREPAPGAGDDEPPWVGTASPAVPGTTGDRFFRTDSGGSLLYRTSGPFPLDVDAPPPSDARPLGR